MRPSAPWIRASLALLILVAALLSASTWLVYSHTAEEPRHLAAGLDLLDRGRYEYDTEHPPIARVMIALGPWLAGAHSYGTPAPDGLQEGLDILYNSGHYWLYLTLARLGALPFLAVLLLAQWLWARRTSLSDIEALLGVGLLASVPPILGHAALATIDVPAAATDLVALYLIQRWVMNGGVVNAILMGLATGVAFGTKLSAVPFLGLGALALIAACTVLKARSGPPAPAPVPPRTARVAEMLASAVLIVIALCVPIVLAYGESALGVTTLPGQFHWALAYLIDGTEQGRLPGVIRHVWLPGGLWDLAEGLARLKERNEGAFLLDPQSQSSGWDSYLIALAAKTPLPLIASSLPGFVLMLRDGWRERDPWLLAPVVLFVAILVFASVHGPVNIGVRQVLVLYPFMALSGAYALARAWRWLADLRMRPVGIAGRVLIAGIVLWQVGTLWLAHPDYLPYFNEAVAHPDQVLTDSDLDWGQDLGRLERRLAQLKVPRLSLAYIGTADLPREPLPPWTPLEPMKPVKGWIAITELAREHDPSGYAWLSKYRPVERIGKTIELYHLQ